MTGQGLPGTDQFAASASELIDTFTRKGLMWQIRLATVQGLAASLGNQNVQTWLPAPIGSFGVGNATKLVPVIFDGDTVSVGVYSMIGQLLRGTRVFVISVPPGTNFIVGLASHYRPLGLVASPTISTTNGTATSGTTETFDAGLGTYAFYGYSNRRYRVIISGQSAAATVVGDWFLFRIRNGGLNLPDNTSPIVAELGWHPKQVGGTGGRDNLNMMATITPGTFLNNSGIQTLQLSVQRLTGTGVCTPGSPSQEGGTLGREFYVEDVGPL